MLPKIVITVLAMSHVRIPRNVLIKYYAEVTLSILLSLINWFGRFDGLLSFCSFLWKIHFFPLSMGVLHNHWPLTSNQSPTTILLTWLICSASQVTGFYIMEKLVVKELIWVICITDVFPLAWEETSSFSAMVWNIEVHVRSYWFLDGYQYCFD